MGKTCKVVVCGQAAVGKTAILEQLVNGDHLVGSPMFSTIEDIYVAMVDTDRGPKEKVHFYDTAGLDSTRPEIPKQYLTFADGFVIVYDVTNESSFQCMDKLKKLIEKNKEKKEAVIIALGNKCDLKDSKQVDFNTANKWAQTEKVRLWEVSVCNRQSLLDPFVWITSKMTQPQAKSFQPFSKSKKNSDQ
jgi:NF-kappa-B inhibitor-interacting Ras-like protein